MRPRRRLGPSQGRAHHRRCGPGCPFRVRPGGRLRSAMNPRNSVTQLLHDWRAGQSDALERLTPLVYDELRRLAERYMKGERAGHTLQATAIVHEAYVRLIDMQIPWEDRAHFFTVAARLMRRILVDHAKTRRAEKRGVADVTVFELKSHDAQVPDIGYDIVD